MKRAVLKVEISDSKVVALIAQLGQVNWTSVTEKSLEVTMIAADIHQLKEEKCDALKEIPGVTSFQVSMVEDTRGSSKGGG